MNSLFETWNWYIAGPIIGLIVPLLLIIGNKLFGISSSFRHLCSMALPKKKIAFLNYNWKDHRWNLFFVGGIALGGPDVDVPRAARDAVRVFAELARVLLGHGRKAVQAPAGAHADLGTGIEQVGHLKSRRVPTQRFGSLASLLTPLPFSAGEIPRVHRIDLQQAAEHAHQFRAFEVRQKQESRSSHLP